ncbi:hypothetical protein V2I01_08810 [Micromonospora sp. BRA006-A]|nr:hypothetical protein [Micromonospora sp. BRA006-A]
MIDQELADRLCAVDGVVAVALGGSLARGDHRPTPTGTWASTATGVRRT